MSGFFKLSVSTFRFSYVAFRERISAQFGRARTSSPEENAALGAKKKRLPTFKYQTSSFEQIQLKPKKWKLLIISLSRRLRDGVRPRHRDLFLLVSQPLSRQVILPVVSRHVVVKERDCWIGVVLDPLEGGSQVRHEEGRGHLGGGGQALQQELVTLLQPDVHGSHGLVGEGANAELLVGTVVNFEQLK